MATTVSQPRATSMDKRMYYPVTAPAARGYYVVTPRSDTFLSGGGVPQKINRDCTLNCASIPIVLTLLCKINYLCISLAERVGFEPKLR